VPQFVQRFKEAGYTGKLTRFGHRNSRFIAKLLNVGHSGVAIVLEKYHLSLI
jgi:hypothetical protein